jgi:tol-pal system protein YbgF
LAVIEQKLAAPPETPMQGGDVGPAPAFPPAEAFAEARQLMLNGDYDAAERAWRTFVTDNPSHPKTPEAQYWFGKTLAARSAHAEAAAAYIGAVRGWPQTGWGADAAVELARELTALKKLPEACQTLGEFSRRYPKANAAVKSRAAATRTQAKCA